MAVTLLRASLWLIILVLAAYILRDVQEGALSGLLSDTLLERAGLLGVALLALSLLVFLFEKMWRPKGRCRVCRKAVFPGELFCRLHLRSVIEEEEDRLHAAPPRRR